MTAANNDQDKVASGEIMGNTKFTMDALGRILIEDPALLALVQGAASDVEMMRPDNGCDNNAACNSNC